MPEPPPTALQRTLSTPLLCLYGLGTILGAGIYVLVGKVAGHAGMHAPIAFAAAAAVAAVTGLSFAELCSRFPESAGEAAYVREGLGSDRLATAVGLMVLTTGVVSAATIAVGFHGYAAIFVSLPRWLAVCGVVALLTALATWGIAESVKVAALITLVEVGGLILVIASAGDSLAELPARLGELAPPGDLAAYGGIATGAFLAFYAFIGFEDMVNVAEEVVAPRRAMPIAIGVAIGVSAIFYLVVAVVAVSSLPVDELADSAAPLAAVYRAHTGSDPLLISAISMFAVVNGALIQIVMGSRVLYGLSRRGWLPRWLAEVHPRRRTPVRATVLVGVVVAALAALIPLETLARITSFIILLVFAIVNVALARLHRRERHDGFRVPRAIPIAGALLCLALVLASVL